MVLSCALALAAGNLLAFAYITAAALFRADIEETGGMKLPPRSPNKAYGHRAPLRSEFTDFQNQFKSMIRGNAEESDKSITPQDNQIDVAANTYRTNTSTTNIPSVNEENGKQMYRINFVQAISQKSHPISEINSYDSIIDNRNTLVSRSSDKPINAQKGRERLSSFGNVFGGYGGAPCHRSSEFLKPGPLVIGGVGDSGTSAIVTLIQTHLILGVCGDYGGSVDALYMLKPETVYPDKLAGNNTNNHSMVAHFPWTLLGGSAPFNRGIESRQKPRISARLLNESIWTQAYRDVCGAVGSTIDCLAGCSVLRRSFGSSVRNMRKKFKLVADRPTFLPQEECKAHFKVRQQQQKDSEDGRLWGWKVKCFNVMISKLIFFLPLLLSSRIFSGPEEHLLFAVLSSHFW